jgi:hypothetical protein
VGIYSLLIGFTFIYGLTTIFNLILLNKHCAKKPKYLKFLSSAVCLLIPTIFLGAMLEKMLLPILGTFFTFILSAIAMVVFNTALYLGFGLVEFKFLQAKIKGVLSKKYA